MGDREGLLAAILANPAEDAPRLMFADLLDEQGEAEWAEFIRVQVELAKRGMLRGTEDEETWHLACDACRIVGKLNDLPHSLGGAPWFKERPHDAGRLAVEYEAENGPNPELVLHRGFVAEVRCPLAAWLAHGPAIVRAHPVESVRLTDRAPLMAPGVGRRAWLADDTWLDNVPDDCRVGSLFSHLPKTPGVADNLRVYESAELALAGLSAAAISWAKSA